MRKRILNLLPLAVFLLVIAILINGEDRRSLYKGGDSAETGSSSVKEGSGEDGDEEYPMSRDAFLLDTYCTISIYEGGGSQALEEALEQLELYDRLFSPEGEDSDISRINNRQEYSLQIDPETAELFESVDSVYESAEGDFEIGIGALTDLWDIKERTEPPNVSEIDEARKQVFYKGFQIERREDGSCWFISSLKDIKVDVGAFAKGYIADRLKDILMDSGVSSAIINLGGNVLCFGKDRDGDSFKVGVRYPEHLSDEIAFTVEADDISVVTAGTYERYFEYEGRRYHHILDPATGYPADSDLCSVTVAGESSALCDALCTTLLIKGRDEGESWLRKYNQDNKTSYEAWFIDEDMNVTHTKG